jgi:hypothetical protein
VAAVGPDHHPGVLAVCAAAGAMATNPDHPSAVDDHVGDGEALADLGAGLGGRLDQQLVQDGAAGAVGDGGVVGAGAPLRAKGPKSNR